MSKKKSKRANGEGTFYQLDNHSWVHQITLGFKEDGKPNRKSFKGQTRAECIEKKEAYLAALKHDQDAQESEAQARLREMEQAARLGHSVESEILFSEAFPAWLALYKAPPIKKPTTYGAYQDTYEIHFKPFFGVRKLCDITQDVVQEYYQGLQADGARRDGKPGGLSPKTIRNYHMLLKDFFDYAKKKFKLSDNPTEDTQRPEVHTPPMRVLSQEEMVIFIQEVMRETQRVAILFDLLTGLRKGELLALEMDDLNLATQSIKVQRNLTRVNTRALNLQDPNVKIIHYNEAHKTQLIVQNTPKTKTSCREIPLSDGLCELLVRHIFTMQHSEWPNPNNLLFPSSTGTYVDPKSFEIRLNAVSKRCEIKKVNPHALRHTFATRLVEEDVPLGTVKDLLGHASITTTQIYTHKNTELEREAVTGVTGYLDIEKLAEAKRLNGAKKQMKFASLALPDFSQQGKCRGNR